MKYLYSQSSVRPGTFNLLEGLLKQTFRILAQVHNPVHKIPTNLADWERHARMAVLTYGAYFQAFKHPGEQIVGGGADTVSLPWPENP